ncbi:MAG: 2-oxoacid:acceptor oxidoreductase family protein [Thermodesulfobacteriota bacterium]|nr:2-oxoacid:acceptor oxidoreductase family protein [Thermodesulfobacteriota bacterium]
MEASIRDDLIAIRWHGRGGQGAITAARLVAESAFASGYGGAVMTPTFGTERRGAPVMTSLKIARQKIYDLSPISKPDMVVVLDHLLMEEADVTGGLKPGGLVLINSPNPPEAYEKISDMTVATADVTAIAVKAGLPMGIVNTGIIGAFAKASGVVTLDSLIGPIERAFQGKRPNRNVAAAKMAYEQTRMTKGLLHGPHTP